MTDYGAQLALFLRARTGSIYGTWTGRMTAQEQRALFGRYFGKGRLFINGTTEQIEYTIKIDFGRDWETTRTAFKELN